MIREWWRQHPSMPLVATGLIFVGFLALLEAQASSWGLVAAGAFTAAGAILARGVR